MAGLDLTGGDARRDPLLREAVERFSVREFDLPPIVEFAEHPKLLAGPKLYPRQRTLLRLIFVNEELTDYDRGAERHGVSPDVLERREILRERGYLWFREVLNVSGRRGSKNLIGAVCGAYLLWRLCMIGNPQAHYGLAPGKELAMLCFGTSEDQAKEDQFADLKEAITFGPCFDPYRSGVDSSYRLALRTPVDRAREEALRARGGRREVATLSVTARPTVSRSGRGPAAFCVFFDELAHVLNRSGSPQGAEELYSAAVPAMDQVREEAFLYMPTSPWQKIGPPWETYQAGLRRDDDLPAHPEVLVVQLPSWGIFEDWRDRRATGGVTMAPPPLEYNEVMASQERRDPVKFMVERRAQFAEVMDAYLMAEVVDRAYRPVPAFVKWPEDWWETAGLPYGEGGPEPADVRHLEQRDGVLRWSYRAHLDPAKSGHRCVLVVGQTEPYIERAQDERGREALRPVRHVFVDRVAAWDPADYPTTSSPTTGSWLRSPRSAPATRASPTSPPTSTGSCCCRS